MCSSDGEFSRSAEQFASQIRRLFRVLLHCYHAHRDVFKQFESEYYLAKRVVVFARRYQFLDDDTLAQIPVAESTASEKTEEGEEEEQEEEEEDGERKEKNHEQQKNYQNIVSFFGIFVFNSKT